MIYLSGRNEQIGKISQKEIKQEINAASSLVENQAERKIPKVIQEIREKNKLLSPEEKAERKMFTDYMIKNYGTQNTYHAEVNDDPTLERWEKDEENDIFMRDVD